MCNSRPIRLAEDKPPKSQGTKRFELLVQTRHILRFYNGHVALGSAVSPALSSGGDVEAALHDSPLARGDVRSERCEWLEVMPMPWTCPACRMQVKHSAATPNPEVVYRCSVCRLQMKFDPAVKKMKPIPPNGGNGDGDKASEIA